MKYELTDNKKLEPGQVKPLYQIRALTNIQRHGVKAGDLGGWVSGMHNLSQTGDSWIDVHSTVTDDARIQGEAIIERHSYVSGNASIMGYATIRSSKIKDKVKIFNQAEIRNCEITLNTHIYGNSKVSKSKIGLIGSEIQGGIIDTSSLFGRNVLITGTPILTLCEFSDITDVTIKDSVKLNIVVIKKAKNVMVKDKARLDNVLIQAHSIHIADSSVIIAQGQVILSDDTKLTEYAKVLNKNSELFTLSSIDLNGDVEILNG